ncbi:MAG: class I SAM-dependent methyltransferase, partial [Acidimicrobiales bacterium]
MAVADLVTGFLGTDLPVRFEAYDGSTSGSAEAPATVVLKSKDALRRIVARPGELGFARAYVAGDLDVEGDIYAVLSLGERLPAVRLGASQVARLVRLVGPASLRPLPTPPEEAHLRGQRHSKERDAAAVRHHYDVGNEFYEMVLGPSLTYSCAVFTSPEETLEVAQANKYELVSRKLGLEPGMRLLDVGCGWGGMVLHAADMHGVDAVGVTLSHEQFELASKRAVDGGLSDRVEIRVEDYRDIADGPYDGISSIGMFEHVGEARLAEYFARLFDLLPAGGRLLNHGISRPPGRRARFSKSSFIDRYVFPDGELHEVGRVISVIQRAGFEVRHVESLREHYALTLRHWVANLEASWDRAVDLVGPARARVWHLYMAGSALNFEANRTQIHQVLAVKP